MSGLGNCKNCGHSFSSHNDLGDCMANPKAKMGRCNEAGCPCSVLRADITDWDKNGKPIVHEGICTE